MSLAQEKINTLKKLTALKDANISLDSVVDSFEALRNDTLHVSSTPLRSGAQTLHLRKDIVSSSQIDPSLLLAASPQKVLAHQISLSSIMHGE